MKMPTAETISSSSALHLLHRAGQTADELFAINVADNGLTPRQYAVLKAVAANKKPSQTLLVEKTGIDRSTLADIVRRLEARGLLARQRTLSDARKYAIHLTDSGKAALLSAEPAVKDTNERLLAALSDEERAIFLNALGRMIDANQSEEETENGRAQIRTT